MGFRRVGTGLIAASAIAALACASPVLAQTPDQSFFYDGRPYDPADYYLNGRPDDTSGCFRQCERDFAPCDSALDKKVDGRCNRNF